MLFSASALSDALSVAQNEKKNKTLCDSNKCMQIFKCRDNVSLSVCCCVIPSFQFYFTLNTDHFTSDIFFGRFFDCKNNNTITIKEREREKKEKKNQMKYTHFTFRFPFQWRSAISAMYFTALTLHSLIIMYINVLLMFVFDLNRPKLQLVYLLLSHIICSCQTQTHTFGQCFQIHSICITHSEFRFTVFVLNILFIYFFSIRFTHSNFNVQCFFILFKVSLCVLPFNRTQCSLCISLSFNDHYCYYFTFEWL